MEKIEIHGRYRSTAGKGPARQLRREGKIPAVIYSKGTAKPLILDLKEVDAIRHSTAGENAIITLKVLDEKEKVLVVPKHFPGYDDVSFNPENNVIPKVSELPSIDVFQDVFFSTNQQFVMVAHVIYESVDPVRPFPFSKVGIELIRDVLSRDIVVMSDDLTSEAIIDQYNVAEIGARSLAAGVDILLLAGHKNPGVIGDFYEGLVKLVEQDEYLQAQVAASAQKIIQIKKTL